MSSEEVKNVHREPHPFVGTSHMVNFVGRTIAFVGKIERVLDNELIMQQAGGKYLVYYAWMICVNGGLLFCFRPRGCEGDQI